LHREKLRHRGLAARSERLSGNLVLQQFSGFPGPTRQHTLSSEWGREGPPGPHAERFRSGDWPNLDRRHGKLPGGRRDNYHSGGPPSVSGGTKRDPAAKGDLKMSKMVSPTYPTSPSSPLLERGGVDA